MLLASRGFAAQAHDRRDHADRPFMSVNNKEQRKENLY